MIPSGDKVGRKRAMLAGIAVILPSMFLGGFVGRYSPYILLRFATCTAIVFCWVSAHNLVVGCRSFVFDAKMAYEVKAWFSDGVV